MPRSHGRLASCECAGCGFLCSAEPVDRLGSHPRLTGRAPADISKEHGTPLRLTFQPSQVHALGQLQQRATSLAPLHPDSYPPDADIGSENDCQLIIGSSGTRVAMTSASPSQCAATSLRCRDAAARDAVRVTIPSTCRATLSMPTCGSKALAARSAATSVRSHDPARGMLSSQAKSALPLWTGSSSTAAGDRGLDEGLRPVQSLRLSKPKRQQRCGCGDPACAGRARPWRNETETPAKPASSVRVMPRQRRSTRRRAESRCHTSDQPHSPIAVITG